MMKRLSVLFMVLALASTSNAALSFYIDGSPAPATMTIQTDEVITIQLHSSDASFWLAYGGLRDTGVPSTMVGGMGNGHTYKGTDFGPDGGNAGEIGDIVFFTNGFEAVTGSTSGQVVAGIQHRFDYSSSEEGTATLGLFLPPNYSWDGDEIDRIDITVVPEPTTITLLGLGALCLLRKRKTQSHY
ncbi:MAG: PEP-CTERM sorting domain-containing protein [Planctomycetota bacterium]|nr:MAG: PEP-CTERM sorting domain-containing protein [Planctomycetota bacterium]